MKYYSPTTKGFYTKEVHGDNMPSDVIEVSEADYNLLMEEQSNGSIIQYNGSKLILVLPNNILTPEQLLVNLKSVKDKAVADKLALHQYDSLATVKLWADDIDYGIEATALLEWYKNVTKMSIALENDVKAGTKPIPTEAEYQAMIDGVVF